MSRSITDWRSRLEPILVEKVGTLHDNALAGMRSLIEQPRIANFKSTGTKEQSKMAERADDLDTPMKLRPPAANKMSPRVVDPSRLGGDGANAAGSPPQSSDGSAGSRGNEVDRRTLIVGQGISLAGEVNACDRLIVEGSIQATLQKCQHVIIAETGVFNGHASTENADVRGRFEGDLVVRKRLLIRAGGHVSGKITYGEIEIESGGAISGTIEVAEAAKSISMPFPMSA
jgi:cytoskeletal protein CcmA (bactofilin family)